MWRKRLGVLCLVWDPRLYFLPGIWSLDLFLLAGERESRLGGGGCCSKGLHKTLEVSLPGPWFSLCPPNLTWTGHASSEMTPGGWDPSGELLRLQGGLLLHTGIGGAHLPLLVAGLSEASCPAVIVVTLPFALQSGLFLIDSMSHCP